MYKQGNTITFTFFVILFLVLVRIGIVAGDSVMEVARKNEIVPDVIDSAPDSMLSVMYKHGIEANLGNMIKPSQADNEPRVNWDNAESNKLYLLAMVDPDTPSRKNPRAREWKHWIVANIRGSNVDGGEVITDYNGPTPPKGSGPHRYVFLLYEQPGRLNLNADSGDRARFSIRNFAKNNQLGDPVAMNFFFAENK